MAFKKNFCDCPAHSNHSFWAAGVPSKGQKKLLERMIREKNILPTTFDKRYDTVNFLTFIPELTYVEFVAVVS